jgi:hypothetical protein
VQGYQLQVRVVVQLSCVACYLPLQATACGKGTMMVANGSNQTRQGSCCWAQHTQQAAGVFTSSFCKGHALQSATLGQQQWAAGVSLAAASGGADEQFCTHVLVLLLMCTRPVLYLVQGGA